MLRLTPPQLQDHFDPPPSYSEALATFTSKPAGDSTLYQIWQSTTSSRESWYFCDYNGSLQLKYRTATLTSPAKLVCPNNLPTGTIKRQYWLSLSYHKLILPESLLDITLHYTRTSPRYNITIGDLSSTYWHLRWEPQSDSGLYLSLWHLKFSLPACSHSGIEEAPVAIFKRHHSSNANLGDITINPRARGLERYGPDFHHLILLSLAHLAHFSNFKQLL